MGESRDFLTGIRQKGRDISAWFNKRALSMKHYCTMGIHGCRRSFNCIDSYKRTLFILGHKVKVLNIYISLHCIQISNCSVLFKTLFTYKVLYKRTNPAMAGQNCLPGRYQVHHFSNPLLRDPFYLEIHMQVE